MGQNQDGSGAVLTEATPPAMLNTLPNTCEFDSWFAPVAPDYFTGLFEVLLMICEGNEIVKGDSCTTPSKSNVGRGSRERFSSLMV